MNWTACRVRRAFSLGSPPSATSPALTPSASLRSSSASPLRVCVARCGLRRHRPLHFAILYCPFQCQHLCQSLRQRASHDCLQLPLHFPPLSRRGGSLPRVLRPRRFPFAHTPGLPFLTACRGFGFHTPRIPDAGGAIRTLGPQLSAHPPPFDALLLLDRAYVAPIHAVHSALGHTRLRLSCTDTRAVHASRCRKHRPIHDRHTLMMAASAPAAPFVSDPDMPDMGTFADIPALGFPIGHCIEPVHNTCSHHFRASDNPKSLRRSRSGSYDRKGTLCFMPAGQPLRARFRSRKGEGT